MWCVMKCLPGEAQKVMESCKANLSRQALHDVFMFTCERMKRYQGSWHLETRQMFPDCLFLETEDPEQLARELEPYRAYACVGGNREMLQNVPPEAEDFLRRLCGLTFKENCPDTRNSTVAWKNGLWHNSQNI